MNHSLGSIRTNGRGTLPDYYWEVSLRGSYPIIYIIGSLVESLLTLSGSERGTPRGSNPPSRNA